MPGEWTGAFVAEKAASHDKVLAIELLGPQLVKILRREELSEVVVATFAEARLTSDIVERVLNDTPQANFIANIRKESFITGSALDAAELLGVDIGGFGDLLSSLSLQDVSEYRNKEFAFVERGLRQHDRVSDFVRLNDRHYRIDRRDRPSVVAVFLNAYELTADHVRTARERYGAFDLVVITNPNGGATRSAEDAAGNLRAEIHMWGSFLGRLNA